MLFSCDPIEKRLDIGSEITANELNITAVPLMVNGKRSNKIIVNNDSPVLSSWDFGTGTTQKKTDTVLMVVAGENEIIFTGLNPLGTKVSKTLTFIVDELTFPVPPEWAFLTDGKEKTWKWDETKPAVWGNGGYLINVTPAWWAVKEAEMNAQEAGEGVGSKMVLALRGAKLEKIRSTGEKLIGSFSFDMSQVVKSDDGKIWSYGKFKTKGTTVLVGKSPEEGNSPIYEFDIMTINDKELVLAYAPAGAAIWATTYYWVFRAVE
ncbi:hypothetical protein [Sphingobacterium sp. MYb382]|uniref:hypothetical protein n=1 Tax=Sphingobacterium sp. MYb382 TaxID=2745278 RepID=UPI0030A1D47B